VLSRRKAHPDYVQKFTDRHGHLRYYFRRHGSPRAPLPGLPWTPEFMAAYNTALAGTGKRCVACDEPMPVQLHGSCKYCDACSAPAIYRFVCPDGRSYVGSTSYPRDRNLRGLERSNSWLLEAFERHPPETWTYEVLEKLPYGCSKEEVLDAEQQHIERLGSWMKEHGFNVHPAVWEGNSPAISAGRARREQEAANSERSRNNQVRLW
jgi:hypothetical protein